MSKIKTDDGTEIFFKDWGTGQPIVFHHGWPLSADEWDNCIPDHSRIAKCPFAPEAIGFEMKRPKV